MKVGNGAPLSIFLCLFLIPFLFQNCAQQNFGTSNQSSTGTTKLASPFENQKIIIDYKSLQKKSQNSGIQSQSKFQIGKIPANTHLVVNINNQCAVGFCEDEKNSNSKTCQLFSKYSDKRLINQSQAYVLVTDKDHLEKDFIKEVFGHEIDSYCLVGISQREVYKINLDTSSAEYLASYHHQILKTSDAYDFFRSEFNKTSSTAYLSSVKVGVIDTGVDFTHPEFAGGTKGGSTNYSAACPSSICNFHGTFVGGIIAASLSGNQGSFGIAPNAVLYSYQIGDKNGAIPSEELINAIKKATSDGMEVLNLSLGGSSSLDASYQAALVDAINKNITIVAAAGNSNNNLDLYPSYPTSFGFDGIISVGSASPNLISPLQANKPTADEIASAIKKDTFSNYSSKLVGIAAPGTAVFSTTPGGAYGIASGTSFAAPMVTGAIVLARGYLKLKNFSADQITPTLLKSVLYDSAEIVATLTEKVDVQDVTYFTNNRYLNIAKLKTYVVEYVNRLSTSPARIELSEFSVYKNGSNKTGKFKVEIRDADPSLRLTLRVYTNRAFKNESEIVSAQCLIDEARKFCSFDIPFEKMLIDPEIYIEITDSKGIVISSLTIPKENLNFGVKEESELAGELVSLSLASGRPVVEGWACLIGFPDKLEIEIRKNSATGELVQTLKPTRQGRGNYFAACDSADITFGFTWNVVGNDNYYFIAKHPTTPAKNIILKAYSYLPKYNDSLPAQYIDYINVDKNWSATSPLDPEINISKFSFDNLVTKIQGSACFPGVYKPAIVSFEFNASRLETIFENPTIHYTNDTMSTYETAKSYDYFSKNQQYNNVSYSNRTADKDNLGLLSYVDIFSEIAVEYNFSGAAKLSEASKPYLVEGTDMVSNRRIASTQNPVGYVNTNCVLPSGFDFTYNMGPDIQNVKSATSVSYRSDKITLDQVWAQDPNLKKFVDVTTANNNFTDLNFNKLSFNFNLVTNYNTLNLVDTRALTSSLTPISEIAAQTKSYGMQPISEYFKSYVVDKSISSSQDNPTSIWESDWISLSYASKSSLVSFDFDQGVKFGTIGEDFILEVIEEDQVTVTKPYFDIRAYLVGSYYKGKMYAEVFTKNKNSKIKLRLLSNKKNQLRLFGLGVVTL